MDEEKNKKGFAGLSSLASKVDEHGRKESDEPQKSEEVPTTLGSDKTSAPASSKTSHRPAPSTSPAKPDASSGWKWLVGIVAVIAVIAVINDQSRKPSSQPSSYKPPTSSYQKPTSPSPVAKIETPSPATITKPAEPQLTFLQPPIGRDNVLSVPEIRWCQRESIRLDTKKPLIETNSQVAAFNRIVDEYNRRCGSYRYRQGSLERAKREVEELRIEIEKAARAEFAPEIKQATKPPVKQTAPVQQKPASNSAQTKLSSRDVREVQVAPEIKQETKPPENQTAPLRKEKATNTAQTKFSSRDVRDVQRLLSELGYQPGPVDGSYGLRTASAVKDFQRNFGIDQDGLIDKNLLTALKIAAKKKSDAISSSASPQSTVSQVTASEQLKIEKHCSLLTSTPGNRYDCIQRELKNLKQSGAKPDLSRIAPDEKVQIEKHCSLLTSTPGDEYNCIRRELNNLLQSKGKPDLSRIAPDERMQIEKHCSLLTSTPGDEYNCIRRELTKLRQSGGKPDLSRIPLNDRAQIVKHCSLLTSTPGDEYNCIRRELRKVN